MEIGATNLDEEEHATYNHIIAHSVTHGCDVIEDMRLLGVTMTLLGVTMRRLRVTMMRLGVTMASLGVTIT